MNFSYFLQDECHMLQDECHLLLFLLERCKLIPCCLAVYHYSQSCWNCGSCSVPNPAAPPNQHKLYLPPHIHVPTHPHSHPHPQTHTLTLMHPLTSEGFHAVLWISIFISIVFLNALPTQYSKILMELTLNGINPYMFPWPFLQHNHRQSALEVQEMVYERGNFTNNWTFRNWKFRIVWTFCNGKQAAHKTGNGPT